MKQPSKEQMIKLLTINSIPAVIGDFIEDCIEDGLIRFEAKKHFNDLLKQIRKTDTFMTKGIDLKTADEQAMIQQWFRQQIKQQIDIEQ